VRLIACTSCHTQYDVSEISESEISCRCGAKMQNRDLTPLEVEVHRCGSCGAQVGSEAESCSYCGSEIQRDPLKLSLICPECYGRNEEKSRYCVGCGVAFQPEQVEAEGHELPCPACQCLMPVSRIGGVGINECSQCNGIWVPGNRFDELVAKACQAAESSRGRELRAANAGREKKTSSFSRSGVVYRSCPVCDAHMQRSNFQKRSGVIVDRCHKHGTWLDADELEAIARFVIEGGMGSDAARRYTLKTEIDAMKRREAAALARAVKGESIVIREERSFSSEEGGLFGLLMDILK
jgi:Zn-finger nucleic acid-binding protein